MGQHGEANGWLRRLAVPTLAVLLAAGCGGAAPPPELDQAVRAFSQQLGERELSRSMYAAAFPGGGTPEQFVSYFFSDLGKAEWPSAMDADEAEQMRAVGLTVFPMGVAIVPRNPDPVRGIQLVIGYDQGRGVILARGYTDPTKPPMVEKEWTLPAVRPTPQAEAVFRSNLESGASYQAF